ncbi:MAG TPA: hypothetical protein VIX19_21365 [Terriglobales bacterium]
MRAISTTLPTRPVFVTVGVVKEYQCPVNGTVGTHITVMLATASSKTIWLLSSSSKEYDIVIIKGDHVEIQGAKITFKGNPTDREGCDR